MKVKKLDWKEKHKLAFKEIKDELKTRVENKYFNINNKTRVKSDASKEGLGLYQNQGNS